MLMTNNGAILLISDRPDRSRQLAHRLGELCACRTLGLDEQPGAAGPLAAVVTDVGLRDPGDIARLRRLLSRPRRSATPTFAILRDNAHLERIQAGAIGVTGVFPAHTTVAEICAALAAIVRPAVAAATSETDASGQNVDQIRSQFETIFDAATRGVIINRKAVDGATASVLTAIADRGIRHWLEVVWEYHDATYQHCLLVTGLAAQFAVNLKFSANDQSLLVRGALLHDIGKAKIPLAILNKPDVLTAQEMELMRQHALLGYDILREQGEYETEVLEVVLRHHEMLDGSGYPDGIAGTQIKDLVRLVTICDIYAALVERRPYREAMEPTHAFKILEGMEGPLEGALLRAFTPVARRAATPSAAAATGYLARKDQAALRRSLERMPVAGR
jgi:putative nucleotidyltransferase with HDIG domain